MQRRALLVVVADGLHAVGRGVLAALRGVARGVLALAFLAGVIWGGRLAVRHVLASPRFAVREVEVSPTSRVGRQEILTLAAVAEGDRLLAVDTDAVAARVARHPWVASVRVQRQLPAVVVIDVIERRAAAIAALGGLYLVDEAGRPFKRATVEEADGLAVLTGIERATYLAHKEACEAAFREALGVLAAVRSRPERPAVSEVNVDPRFGLTVFAVDGGAEIRLGRGEYDRKLAQLDRILEAVETPGIRTVRVVHLDGADSTRVPVKLQRTGS